MNLVNIEKKLSKKFYTGDLLKTAKNLLGKLIVKKENEIYLAGMITEVEAYDGSIDEAAHSFRGITERIKVMFDEGGCLYVYFTYGAHFCSNVVAGKKGEGKAILIRAVEPLNHFEELARNRFGKKDINEKEKIQLTNGPGKFCKAFGITKQHNGTDLSGDEIFISGYKKIKTENIVITKRIGITRSVDLPWRFYIKDNPYVSRQN
jgi:DNA-3-methyladenine glycosylase